MPRIQKTLQKHLLQGTQPQSGGNSDGVFVAGKPKMPRDLPDVAQAEWKNIVKQLAKRGTLTRVDSSALEVYARMYAQWRGYCDEVEKYGAMVDEPVIDKNGTVAIRRVQNPAGKLAIQLGNALRMYQKEFSATPASRERTKPATPEKEEYVSV